MPNAIVYGISGADELSRKLGRERPLDISWRGDLTFEQDGFNELDALVLSRLSYLPFDGAVSSS